jgi:dihydrofolate reductase
MNAMPKHVATSRPQELAWNAAPLDGDVPAAVQALKDAEGGPVLVAGSSTLVHTLLRERLVDELRLMVFPVAIGGGLRVFPTTAPRSSSSSPSWCVTTAASCCRSTGSPS